MKLKINPVFRDLLRPLTTDEYIELEQNIKSNGCREAIVIWDGTIIDGHHRYKVCQKHSIPFNTKEMDFPSEADALFWIGRNQKGRRNLAPAELALLALEVEPMIAERAREQQGKRTNLLPNSAKGSTNINTRKELSRIAGVGAGTIYEAKKVKESGNQEVLNKMKSGEISIHRAYTEVMPKPEKKMCNICKKELPFSEFYDSKSSCKKCHTFIKRVGIEDAKKITTFNSVDVDAIIESMAKKEPSGDGCGNDLDNHIIAEYVALVKDFRASINRFVYMPTAFSNLDEEHDSLIETQNLINDLSKILQNKKENDHGKHI